MPYVRLPLIAHFFADLQTIDGRLRCGNRVTFLFNEQLQALFQATLLEQGTWVPPRIAAGAMIERVPFRRTKQQEDEFQASGGPRRDGVTA